jgi:hypothetical protein
MDIVWNLPATGRGFGDWNLTLRGNESYGFSIQLNGYDRGN